MNDNRWTNMTFAEHEKIECSMLIVVKSVDVNHLFNCEMTLQSRRPVYGTTYTTTLLNFKDNAFNFTYQDYDRIEYQQNQFTTNLTAMLAYYCYLIIGHDMDSYQRLGGTPAFQQCEEIANVCQTASMDGSEQKGWLAFESNRNRYALINNLLDEAHMSSTPSSMPNAMSWWTSSAKERTKRRKLSTPSSTTSTPPVKRNTTRSCSKIQSDDKYVKTFTYTKLCADKPPRYRFRGGFFSADR